MTTSEERVFPRGTLYLWSDGILFLGSDMINEPHRHFTASLLLALSGEFLVRTPLDAQPRYCRGMLVAPNTEQSMNAQGAEVAILQIDPETEHFMRVTSYFEREGPIVVLPDERVESLRAITRREASSDAFSPVALWRFIIDNLAPPETTARQLDRRIRDVLRIFKEDILSPPSAAELARRVNLSEGRLIHLFTEQMGLPMRRYALWLRLREAFLTLAEGFSLTEAAHRAGFSDSAHMSRTFRGMFGIPPSFFQEGRGQVKTEFVLDADPEASAHPGDRERWAAMRARATKG